ncbi:beta-galactoside-binding lectin-like [Conger conger]|uniref:beta-galactoside-binding lectin-like n=1 Tax=Conger conger TaxID=82655 RepID=UPI002A5A131D|nr:beta-galactoside-binding lectin-like [Conger conger]
MVRRSFPALAKGDQALGRLLVAGCVLEDLVDLFSEGRRVELQNLSFNQGKELRVTGVPEPNPVGFAINVGESECNIALHINPRFQGCGPGVIVLNAMKDGSWGAEVRDERNFPFRQGEKFEVSITFGNEQFCISLDNGNMLEFPNRLEQPQYSKIWFTGDVRITGMYVK